MGRPKKVIKPLTPKPTFEECLPTIDELINKNRHKWMLQSLSWIDWSDVAQKLRFHLWKKFSQFDASKGTLKSWVSRILHNQLINCWRDLYFSHSRPCLRCPHYQGENLCGLYLEVSTKCDLYKHWYNGKRSKNNIVLSLPMENHLNEIENIQSEDIDIDKTAILIHARMKEILKPLDWQIYDLLFIQHKSEEDVGKLLKYKSTEAGRNPGYKQLSNIKKRIMILVREVLSKEEIEIVR